MHLLRKRSMLERCEETHERHQQEQPPTAATLRLLRSGEVSTTDSNLHDACSLRHPSSGLHSSFSHDDDPDFPIDDFIFHYQSPHLAASRNSRTTCLKHLQASR